MLIITISTPGLVTPENTLGSRFAVFCYCVANYYTDTGTPSLLAIFGYKVLEIAEDCLFTIPRVCKCQGEVSEKSVKEDGFYSSIQF